MGLKLRCRWFSTQLPPCNPQLFLGEIQSREGRAGAACPEPRQRWVQLHGRSLKGRSIASPWLLSLESHTRRLGRGCLWHVSAARVGHSQPWCCPVWFQQTPWAALGTHSRRANLMGSQKVAWTAEQRVLLGGQMSSGLQESEPRAEPGLVWESCHHHVCWGPLAQCKHSASTPRLLRSNRPREQDWCLGRGSVANLCNALEEQSDSGKGGNRVWAHPQSCCPSLSWLHRGEFARDELPARNHR